MVLMERKIKAPLDASERAALADLVHTAGEAECARRIGLSRQSVARAIAGLRVYPGTIALIRLHLGGVKMPQ